jgi:acyl-CoA thioester hydrolase
MLYMKSLDDFHIKVEIPIAWGDMDAFNHVNNAKFFKYFETARIKYFEEAGFIETMEKNSIGPILASISAKFIKPLFYPDTITVGTRVTSIEPANFIMEYIIESKSKGIAAIGESKMVAYDYKSSKRATLPDIVRNKIREIDSI